VESCCLAETKTTPWPSQPVQERAPKKKPHEACWAFLRRRCCPPPPPPAETWPNPLWPWCEASRRKNRMLLARLVPHRGPAFCVSTYHMPCLYGPVPRMQVMNIHASLAAQKLIDFAAGRPCLIMGDFNFHPDTTPYKLFSTGMLSPDDEEFPRPIDGDTWSVSPLSLRLRSAYKAVLGREPELTSYTVTSGKGGTPNDPFIGTLDFIFVSDHWQVKEILPLRSSFEGPLPTATEPSDHIALGATLLPVVTGWLNGWSPFLLTN